MRIALFRARLSAATLILMTAGSITSRGTTPETADERFAVRRRDTARVMTHSDPVIREALAIVGQPLNPVQVVDARAIRQLYAHAASVPPGGLDAFRSPGDITDPNIYVNGDSPVYRRAASRSSALAMLMMAGTLVHEQVHNTDREYAARRLQADFVRSRLGGLSRSERERARQYLRHLDARAYALAVAERRHAPFRP